MNIKNIPHNTQRRAGAPFVAVTPVTPVFTAVVHHRVIDHMRRSRNPPSGRQMAPVSHANGGGLMAEDAAARDMRRLQRVEAPQARKGRHADSVDAGIGYSFVGIKGKTRFTLCRSLL